jgi:triacylglycerol lipase
MSALGFVQNQLTPASVAAPTGLKLYIAAALASSRRLWLPGRLAGYKPEPIKPATSWWQLWGRSPVLPPPPTARLETHIAGHHLQTEVPVGSYGEFDAGFDVPLSAARRGWRIARTHVRFEDFKGDACSVVLGPAPGGSRVTLVVLPPSATLAPKPQAAATFSFLADRRAAQVQRLIRSHADHSFLCYLACVPGDREDVQAELALALNGQGWPHGHLVFVPAAPAEADASLLATIDRLRWLFAGTHDIDLIRVDASEQAVLPEIEDRAPIHVVDIPDEAPAGSRRRHMRPIRSGLVTRHPIVFCHGMLACSMLRLQLRDEYNYFGVLRQYLEERGFRVLFPRVLPTGGVVERAQMLAEQIRRWTTEPINLVAHSMGGLDARYLITQLGMADQVKTLTTISTPHRGSYMADWFRANFDRRVPLLGALRAMGISVEGFNDCRPSVCRLFNERTPDAPQVRYFSYAGEVPLHKVTPMLRRAWDLLTTAEGPNDGLVSVWSARWGEFLGTVYADHFAQTPDGLFVHPSESFDSLTFILRVVENLARRGF